MEDRRRRVARHFCGKPSWVATYTILSRLVDDAVFHVPDDLVQTVIITDVGLTLP
jgi:hypothetical protein